MKIGAMWPPKHKIISPKFYELLIKTKLKGDTTLDLNLFYNHIKKIINAVSIIQEDLIPTYQSMKRKY